MPPTIIYKRGDIVLIPFPFTDLSGSKQRPALIISPDTMNATQPDVVVAAITSQIPKQLAENEFTISNQDLSSSGLLKPSIVKLSKIVTIHQDLVRKKIGSLPPTTIHQILAKIQHLFQP